MGHTICQQPKIQKINQTWPDDEKTALQKFRQNISGDRRTHDLFGSLLAQNSDGTNNAPVSFLSGVKKDVSCVCVCVCEIESCVDPEEFSACDLNFHVILWKYEC